MPHLSDPSPSSVMLHELGHSLDVGRLLELIQCLDIQKLYCINSYSIVGYTVGQLQTLMSRTFRCYI